MWALLDTISHFFAAIAALGAVLISLINRNKLQSLHLDLNSRLTELLATTSRLGHAQGRAELEAELGKGMASPSPPRPPAAEH